MKIKNILNCIRPYLWRLVCTILGLAAAISFLTLGFGKTILILFCCGIGYVLGLAHDKEINILEWIQYWRNKW